MSNTFNEEIEDLEIAVWIQDIDTKEILNSRYLYEYCEHPYPAQNLKLEKGDKIVYKTKFYERTYKVVSKVVIYDTDWSDLQATKDNRITMITCIKDKPNCQILSVSGRFYTMDRDGAIERTEHAFEAMFYPK